MVRKGIVEEIFSKAKFSKEKEAYTISYRDFERIKEMTLSDFIKESENFSKIPVSRILKIKKNNTILFEKTTP